jgi:hypothetical protein
MLEERGEGRRKKKKLLPTAVRHSDGRSTYVGTQASEVAFEVATGRG